MKETLRTKIEGISIKMQERINQLKQHEKEYVEHGAYILANDKKIRRMQMESILTDIKKAME